MILLRFSGDDGWQVTFLGTIVPELSMVTAFNDEKPGSGWELCF